MAITARAIPDQLNGVNFSLNNSIPPMADSMITPIFTTGKTWELSKMGDWRDLTKKCSVR